MAKRDQLRLPIRGVEKITVTEYRAKYGSITKQPRKKNETELVGGVARLLGYHGFLVVRVNSGAMKTADGRFFRAYIIPEMTDTKGKKGSSEGFPDLLALRGRGNRIEAVIVETKVPKGRVSESQKRFAEFALARGVRVEYWWTIEEAERVVNEKYARKQ